MIGKVVEERGKRSKREKCKCKLFFGRSAKEKNKKKIEMINITAVQVLDNPTKFTNPFQFEITFDCNGALDDGKIASPIDAKRLNLRNNNCFHPPLF